MTGAAIAATISSMRALLIPSALVAVFAATPALAAGACTPEPALADDATPIVPIEVDAAVAPSTLAPLATDSPWRARFEAAADELLPALRSGQPARWQPLLGGRWLGERERAAVATLLADECAAFAPLLTARGPIERRILGWNIPASYNPADRAEIAARPDAEALVCWSAGQGSDAAWPRTAAEADNAAGRPYACARIAYSLRGGIANWRAFVERG